MSGFLFYVKWARIIWKERDSAEVGSVLSHQTGMAQHLTLQYLYAAATPAK